MRGIECTGVINKVKKEHEFAIYREGSQRMCCRTTKEKREKITGEQGNTKTGDVRRHGGRNNGEK